MIRLLVLTALLCNAQSEVLVLRADGSSVWAETVIEYEEHIEFVVGGAVQSVPHDAVSELLPRPARNRDYAPEVVETTLATIDRLLAENNSLRERLQPLRDEWQMRQVGTISLDAQITVLVRRYEKSARTLSDFTAFSEGFDALKGQDVTGRNAHELEKARQRVNLDFLGRQVRALENAVRATRPGVAEFTRAEQLAHLLHAHAMLSSGLRQELEALRRRAYQGHISSAISTFQSAPSLTSYLTAHGYLLAAQEHLVSSDKERQQLQTMITGLRRQAAAKHRNLVFDQRGFVYTKGDSYINNRAKAAHPQIELNAMAEEAARLVPRDTPVFGAEIQVDLLVLCRRPLPSGEIGFLFTNPDQDSFVVVPTTLSFENGRALARASCRTRQLKDANVGSPVSVALSIRQPEQDWRPISFACVLEKNDKPTP